jgi:hypothetical protein
MNPVDAYIKKQIKHFSLRFNPPADGRMRLLRAVSTYPAASSSKLLRERQPIFWTRTYDRGPNNNWSIFSFDWSLKYSLGALNLRQVL